MAHISGSILHIKEVLIGFCLGTANIIPGVSGGTFLLIFNIYERVFSILGNINKTNIIYVCRLLFKIVFNSNRAEPWRLLEKFLQDNDFVFFIKLLIGAVVAILSLSSLMKYLIINHFPATYAFFFGLILVSIIIPVQMLTVKKIYLVFFVTLGAALTIYITWAVNPYEKIEKKSALYQAQYSQNNDMGDTAIPQAEGGNLGGNYTFGDYVYAVICGSAAVSAMVLPGISGSLVLILMGAYFEVISAISGLMTLKLENIVFLGCFSVGLIFGGLIFARLLSAVLKKCYNAVMAFLIGLMAGSLYALWPFKQSIVMARQYIRVNGHISVIENVRVYTNINELPAIGAHLILPVIFFMLGCIVMLFFIKKEFNR